MDLEETPISSERIHEGRVINLRRDRVRLPDGKETYRDIVEHRGAVAIVPLLPGGQVALVRQFRLPAGGTLLEIPAGTLDPDEDAVACAHRELQEEIGYRAGKLEPLAATFVAPGYSTELIRLYLATDLQPAQQATDPDEYVEVVTMPFADAVQRAVAGEFRDAKTVCGLLIAGERLRHFRPDEAE